MGKRRHSCFSDPGRGFPVRLRISTGVDSRPNDGMLALYSSRRTCYRGGAVQATRLLLGMRAFPVSLGRACSTGLAVVSNHPVVKQPSANCSLRKSLAAVSNRPVVELRRDLCPRHKCLDTMSDRPVVKPGGPTAFSGSRLAARSSNGGQAPVRCIRVWLPCRIARSSNRSGRNRRPNA